MSETQETLGDLLSDLGLDRNALRPSAHSLLAGESAYLRDLRVNLKNVLASEVLSAKETALIAYAIAVNNKDEAIGGAFKKIALSSGATDPEIAEMAACASMLAVNNVLYRFRHFVGKEGYEKSSARIKMNIMMKPVTGKLFFELVSLAVSAVNGCERCVASHEVSVLAAGATESHVWEAVRIASVVTGLGKVLA